MNLRFFMIFLLILLSVIPANAGIQSLKSNWIPVDTGMTERPYNIIMNSSYEIWIDSFGIRMPLGWYTSEASDSGSAVRTTDAHSGLYALQLTGTDTLAYATTLSFCTPGRYYYFSGWSKTTSYVGGSYIITWMKLSQQPVSAPVMIPITRHTSYFNNTQILQAPDSAVMVSVNIVALPNISVYVDDVTLSDTLLAGIEEKYYSLFVIRQSLKIYPNPASTYFIVDGLSPIDQGQITIYDVMGKVIKVQKFKGLKDEKILLNGIKNGVYFISAGDKQNQYIGKIIIDKN